MISNDIFVRAFENLRAGVLLLEKSPTVEFHILQWAKIIFAFLRVNVMHSVPPGLHCDSNAVPTWLKNPGLVDIERRNFLAILGGDNLALFAVINVHRGTLWLRTFDLQQHDTR